MSLLRYCLDRRVLAVLAAAGLLVALLAPQGLGRALPLLLVAACPLSMAAMALTMRRGDPPAAATPTVESIRRELGDLSARQRRLERELAAIDPNGEG